MKTKVHEFLELASKDADLSERLKKADSAEAALKIVKEKGFDLTEDDFKNVKENKPVSEDELDAVSGGDRCYCDIGGGGVESDYDSVCACVFFGHGEYKDSYDRRCVCWYAGYGGTHNK